MPSVISNWTSMKVSVTLQESTPTSLDGKLIWVEDQGILLELSQGQTYIPMTSVLHIVLKT